MLCPSLCVWAKLREDTAEPGEAVQDTRPAADLTAAIGETLLPSREETWLFVNWSPPTFALGKRRGASEFKARSLSQTSTFPPWMFLNWSSRPPNLLLKQSKYVTHRPFPSILTVSILHLSLSQYTDDFDFPIL